MAAPRAALALEARSLVKTYPGGRGKPRVTALDGVSFGVEPGSVFGLLGPNGAGKSTLVKILASLSRPDSGTALVAGADVARHPDQVRRLIGFVAQKQVADPMDTGRENLELAGRLHGLTGSAARARATELLGRFSLDVSADRQVKTYSGGMARKLDVAIGLMHRPRVLFLDEPTTGLDPEARSELWSEIERMAGTEGMTVLLTTHYLDEADHLAGRLTIVDRGRVVASGTPDELKAGLHGDAVAVELRETTDVARASEVMRRVAGSADVTVEGRQVRVRTADGAAVLPSALAALETAGVVVASATVARPSLDDVYRSHAGHRFDSAAGADVEVAA
ncbi:ATP-binding cassette domain-containing protein [Cellulomonas sp. NTE-D12]|uniref:ATP-binding cassette domain-containing protein n=1 Tax=Cellulomonas sp. NTE-D12 TaxID=2962632 RepID=UPI00308178DA|nr:daunorubicin resistance protein DrrA family ABC transporter ATP-binding protein [Cellulomonas sp. NTE-D12]